MEFCDTYDGNNVNIARVDCTKEKDLCMDFQVDGYPTLYLLKDELVFKYNQKRSIGNLVKFAIEGDTSSSKYIKPMSRLFRGIRRPKGDSDIS